tara:strand:- start:2708 stop:3016 length:309 start_codon:yes stop_codon:yes gene_type:complete
MDAGEESGQRILDLLSGVRKDDTIMGWLLTIWLSLPLADNHIEVRMWFSLERYCEFAQEKFLENPIRYSTTDGIQSDAVVNKSQCRELKREEAALIPRHMRH